MRRYWTAITMLPVFSATAKKRHVAESMKNTYVQNCLVRGNMDG